MASSKNRGPTRKEVLDLLVKDHFENLSGQEIERRSSQYDDTVMEMFQVVKDGKKSKTLAHLFNDIEFEPVFFPPEIHQSVKQRDVFLMTLGRKDDSWYVLWMTGPYS
jgi:hypothetical protein